ncbi:uncharacterized protein UDID_18850 [Ustilago sp. UG-2017a]|nr:uncharacterized protein UDID_18850 [Ustilago sp. UG-2017a]
MAKFLTCLNSTVAAHHVDAIEYSEADYAKLEYRYLKASQASHLAELSDIDDELEGRPSPEPSPLKVPPDWPFVGHISEPAVRVIDTASLPLTFHLRINVKPLDREPFSACLDTSSSVLLIDDAALKLFWHKLTPSDLEQAVAHMNVQCYIIDNLPSHIILGMDFVLRHGILYNAVKGFITLQSCGLSPDMRVLPDYIATFNLHKAFYQMPLHPDDHWKATVLTHHGQETLSCTIMGQSHSVAFLQRVLTDASKAAGLSNRAFVYVDEFGVCLDMLDEHAKHICAILNIIQGLSLTLAQDKTHVARKEVSLLWHLVSGQGTCTMPSKCEAIQLIPYPSMLNQLKHVVGFFSYYKNYVLQFSVLIAPLQCLKTTLLCPSLKTGHAHKNYCTETLFPDYSQPFLLYVDASQQHGFALALHQNHQESDTDTDVYCIDTIHLDSADNTAEVPVWFDLRSLKLAKQSYWPTELEAAAAVWALFWVKRFLDTSPGPHFLFRVHLAVTSFANAKPFCIE